MIKNLYLTQAKKLDALHQSGKHGDLHGIPVGIKDIFDTENMPTTDGTEIHKEKSKLERLYCCIQIKTGRSHHHGKNSHRRISLLFSWQNQKST